MGTRITIHSIRIKNFRSIKNEYLEAKDMNIFVGLNDAGKSNVLKALNLFFCGETDYKTPFDFQRDFTYLYRPESHRPMEEIMDGLNRVVKVGKARYIGISNCFAWQLAKANYYARENGMTEFISIQGHYNLIAREEEREMAPFCYSENIAMTPYSSLAGGRLSKRPGETSKRLEEDAYAKFKYDATAEADARIIARVAELADKRNVSMTEISLAWLLTKVTSPVVGATKFSHADGAAKAVDLELTADEISYLEEMYVPHALVGVMAQNGKQKAGNVV